METVPTIVNTAAVQYTYLFDSQKTRLQYLNPTCVLDVSTPPTPSFPITLPGLPLRQKSGYDENTTVSDYVCQSG